MVETRRVLLADAFAPEPLGGVRTAVVPDGAGVDAAAVAEEMGAAAALLDGDTLHAEGATPERAALAAFGALDVADEVEPGEHAVEIEGEERTVEITERGVWVDATLPAWSQDDADGAAALGVEDGDLLDVPVGSADGSTVVGTEFLSALEGDLPDGAVGYSFETVGADPHVAVRESGGPAGDRACLAVAAALDAIDAFDGAFPDPLVCEVGRFEGRPGEVWVDRAGRVGGPVAAALDGTLAVREADDDIVVA